MTPTHIILHHSLTKDSETVSWGVIRRYHTQELGWRDIGYHFGIELIGDAYQILMGRLPNEPGAHCRQRGMNRRSIGICFVGDYDLLPPPPPMWLKGVALVQWLMEVYAIPVGNIHGHYEFADYKSCPGLAFNVPKFKEDIKKGG